MIKLEYLDQTPKPTVRPPVTAELVAEIARVEVATNAIVATNEDATNAKPVATNDVATNSNNAKPVRTANRRKPEAYREYQRGYMAKRRAAAKVTGPEDRAALAIADSAE
jgi:hypothetical protein